jgi:hypothetical protein
MLKCKTIDILKVAKLEDLHKFVESQRVGLIQNKQLKHLLEYLNSKHNFKHARVTKLVSNK